jgi:hypothetical protein
MSILVALVGALLAVGVPLGPWYRQHRAVERVKKELNADVMYDYQLRGGEYDLDAVPPGPAWLRSLLGDDVFAHVAMLAISRPSDGATPDLDVLLQFPQLKELVVGYEIGNEELKPIGRLPNLETLDIIRSGTVSDAGLEHLGKLTRLRELRLAGDQISDRGLAHLARNTDLRTLILDGTRVTVAGIARRPFAADLELLALAGETVNDATLAGLDALTGLKVLNLFDTKVTDRGLAHLRGLVNLETLVIVSHDPGKRSTDANVEWLNDMRQLKELTLNFAPLGDRGASVIGSLRMLRRLDLGRDSKLNLDDMGLASLCDLPMLEELHLGASKITDAGLPSLAKLPCLKNLALNGTITDAGLPSLARLSHLESLMLHGNFTDSGFASLRPLAGLRSLTISSGVTKAGATAWKRMMPAGSITYATAGSDETGYRWETVP